MATAFKTDEDHLENPDGEKGDDIQLTDLAGTQAAERSDEAEYEMTLHETVRLYGPAIFWAAAISMSLVMEGYDKALIGNFYALPEFAKRYGVYNPTKKTYAMQASWQSALSEASIVGSFFGILMAGWQVDRMGYRMTLLLNMLFMVPCIEPIMLFALVTFAPNKIALFFGELLCGIPWGAFASLGPAYASEVCPLKLRGYLTTFVNLCWVIGQLVAAGVVLGIQGRGDQWAFRIQWVWAVLLIPLLFFCPESPWWLVRHGKNDEAAAALKRLTSSKGHTLVDDKIAAIQKTNELEYKLAHDRSPRYIDCFRGTDLRRTEISAISWAAQITCGNGFAGYVTYFFVQAGLSTKDSFKMNLGTTAAGLVGTMLSWFLLGKLGRRTIFLGGLLWLAAMWMVIGGLAVASEGGHSGAAWSQAVLLLIWVMSYDITIGPIAYCIVGETSSTRLRAKTVGLSRNTFYIFNVVNFVISPYMLNETAWGWAGKAGFFWGGASFLTAIWAYFRLPEMKNRTFYELDVLFERRIGARSFKVTSVDRHEAHAESDHNVQ